MSSILGVRVQLRLAIQIWRLGVVLGWGPWPPLAAELVEIRSFGASGLVSGFSAKSFTVPVSGFRPSCWDFPPRAPDFGL